MLTKELQYISELTVDEEVTALTMGSGDLPVLATPALVALMENSAMKAVAPELDNTQTTVGAQIEVKHLKPSRIGATIKSKAVLVNIDGKKLSFQIEATDNGILIATASHIRFIVDRKRFMERLEEK